mgnify:FL=1
MRILLADDAALLREGLAGLLAAAGHEVVAQVADADALRTEVARLAAVGELPDVVVTDVRMPPTRTDDGLRAAVDLRAAHPGLPVVVLSAYVAGPYLGELIEGVDGAVGYLLKERVGRVSDFMHSLDVVVSGGIVIDPEVLTHLMTSAAGAIGAGAAMADPMNRTGALDASGDPGASGGGPAASAPAGPQNPRCSPPPQDWPPPQDCPPPQDWPPPPPPPPPQSSQDPRHPQNRGLERLTPRETEVLTLMAEGLSNGRIAQRLMVSDGAVAKHVANIFLKLDLPPGEENRRVRAVLVWVRAHA